MTRKEQWLQRRDRYAQKMRRAMHTGGTVFTGGGLPRRRKNKHPVPATGKQREKSFSAATNAAEPPGLFSNPPLITVDGGGYGTPPHQHVQHVPLIPGPGTAAERRAFAYYGGHQRRRKYFGHRPGRQNGYQRQVYFAELQFFFRGCFPAWDPLGRVPVGDASTHNMLLPFQRAWP